MGLVPGSNRLRVRAERAHSSSAEGLRVRVPHKALWADAGDDVGMTAGAPTLIGAKPAGPTASPGLRRSWRILSGPDGTDATLADRREAQPVIHTSTPGTYVLRLTVRHKGDPGASHDTLTVPVSPAHPPDRRADRHPGPDGAITIAGESYGASAIDTKLAYAVFERTTRAKVASGSVDGDANGIATLTDLVKSYGAGSNYLRYLMVVSGRHSPGASSFLPVPQEHRCSGPHIAAKQRDRRAGLPFSAIGIPGAPTGAATYRIPLRTSLDQSGAITGYMQRNQAVYVDNTPVFDYASSERPALDTRAPGSDTNRNVMTVGSSSYQVALSDTDIPERAPAFHVVVLDGQTLKLRRTSSWSRTRRIPEPALQYNAANVGLSKLEGDSIVLAQTIGKPKAAGTEWQGIVERLGLAGANPLLVNALDGTTEYALVGRVNSNLPPVEASTAFGNGRASLHRPTSWAFSRETARPRSRRRSGASPSTTTPTDAGNVTVELTQLAYQSPRPWPELDPGAENYICKQLGFCQAVSSSLTCAAATGRSTR